ncbi:cerato-platanin-related secreted protein [Rhodocollybia butyracea]|uniref:Cerato-platanin-related secreted protein n=1 Tax=Rhodocollybia butyracea TaxID=206335 RepID=A0A9P5PF98_9AGAR|nr:cerato-platanin-related secreted protein [Rhodocollybia butyracea]
MKFSSLVVPVVLAALAAADTLHYDNIYDDGSQSLDVVACSNGANGLETLGYTDFQSLPTFPYIGAFGAVLGWNSAECGSCWKIAYTNAAGKTTRIHALAVDHAGEGLINLSQEAMDKLTDGHAVEFGAVQVTATQVAKSACGIKK